MLEEDVYNCSLLLHRKRNENEQITNEDLRSCYTARFNCGNYVTFVFFIFSVVRPIFGHTIRSCLIWYQQCIRTGAGKCDQQAIMWFINISHTSTVLYHTLCNTVNRVRNWNMPPAKFGGCCGWWTSLVLQPLCYKARRQHRGSEIITWQQAQHMDGRHVGGWWTWGGHQTQLWVELISHPDRPSCIVGSDHTWEGNQSVARMGEFAHLNITLFLFLFCSAGKTTDYSASQ